MGKRERREQERREKNKKSFPPQKIPSPDLPIQSETDTVEVPQKESYLSYVFDGIDIAFQLFFIFQLFRLWIHPNPETAGSLLDSVETLLLLEFSMIPFRILVIAAGRRYGVIIAFIYYAFMSVILFSAMEITSYSYVFILMLLNRMCTICLGKMDKKKMLYIAMPIFILIILLPIQSIFWIYQPSLGLTEKFLDSISYQTEIMDAKFQVLFLIEYFVVNIVSMIVMRRIDWSKEIVIDFKWGKRKKESLPQ